MDNTKTFTCPSDNENTFTTTLLKLLYVLNPPSDFQEEILSLPSAAKY